MNLQLWKVEESEDFFYKNIGKLSPDLQTEFEQMHHEKRRMEWLSARWLLMNILKEYDIPIERLSKDQFGKPYLNECDLHLSISHAFPYVAAVVDSREPTGIDIEIPKEKITKIAPKFMHQEELLYSQDDIYILSLYWCAKETLYKIFGRRQLQFKKHLRIDPIKDGDIMDISGRILLDDHDIRHYELHGHVQEDLVMVHKK